MAKNKKRNKARAGSAAATKRADPQVQLQEAKGAPPRRMRLSEALHVAHSLDNQGRRPLAQSLYSQLMAQCPDRFEPAGHLLRSLINAGNIPAAQMHAHRMLSLLRGNADAVAEVASFYQMTGKTDEALATLSEGLATCAPDTCAVLHRNIGYVHQQRGETVQAADSFNQALAIDDSDVVTLYSMVTMGAEENRDRLLELLLVVEKKAAKLSAQEQSYLNFALAYLFERHDKVRYFSYLKKANDLVKQDPAHFQKAAATYYHHLSSHLTQSIVTTWSEPAPVTDNAPVFIIALPRSGTTLVEQILGAHPEVHGVGEAEAVAYSIRHYYSQSGDKTPYWQWGAEQRLQAATQLEQAYFEHPAIACPAGKTVVDKSIGNFQHVGEIVLTWPNARIVRLRRHPLDTIVSCYHQYFYSGFDRLFDLEALARYYVIVEQYMDFWQSLFPENILTLDYESLVADQEAETRRLLQFCQLPWHEGCLNFHQQVGTVLTVSNQQVRQPIYTKSVARWKPLQEQLRPAINILQRELGLELET